MRSTLEWLARKALQRYWRWQRGMTLGARAIVIDGDGRFLLVRHTYDRAWIFPGGGVERGETVAAALARELEEEAGIEADGPMQLLGFYSNEAAFPGDHIAAYVVRQWRRTREMRPTLEIADAAFFAPDELPDAVNRGVARRIEEVLGRAAVRGYW